ncbi:MAG: hypothetical protein AAGD00_03530 [Planctomycetota bacterium]
MSPGFETLVKAGEGQEAVSLPVAGMLLAGPAGALCFAGLIAAVGAVAPLPDPVSALLGGATVAAGLLVGALASTPWVARPMATWAFVLLAGQGLSLIASLLVGVGVYLTLDPAPLSFGMTGALGYLAGQLAQVRVFSRVAKAADAEARARAEEVSASTGE